jgi:hypothetical protein
MRTTVSCLLALAALVVAVVVQSQHSPLSAQQPAAATKMLRHVVFFKFKADTKPEQIRAVEEAFAALPKKIDVIRDFEWGTDVSVENLSKGFTHCFFVTFENEKGREVYLPHIEHTKFVDIVKPILDDVCVVDYWTKK